MGRNREGKAAVANIFAEFTKDETSDSQPQTKLTDFTNQESSDTLLLTLDALQKKSENTRLKWSALFMQQCSELSPDTFRAMKGDLIHALVRSSEIAESNMTVRENIVRGVEMLIETSKLSFQGTELAQVLGVLLLFKFAPSPSLVELATRLFEQLQVEDQQKLYRSIVKFLIDQIPRRLELYHSAEEDDAVCMNLCQSYKALSFCISNITGAKNSLTDLVEKIGAFDISPESPSMLKLAKLDLCDALVTYSTVNQLDIPTRVVTQAARLYDTEPDIVLSARLNFTSHIIKSNADLSTTVINNILKKCANICLQAQTSRKAEIIRAGVTRIFMPLMIRSEDAAVPPSLVFPVKANEPLMPMSSIILRLVLRALLVGSPREQMALDKKQSISLKDPRSLNYNRERLRYYADVIWACLADVVTQSSAMDVCKFRLGEIDDGMTYFPNPEHCFLGAPETFVDEFLLPVIKKGFISNAFEVFSIDSEIGLLIACRMNDLERMKAGLKSHLAKLTNLDSFSTDILISQPSLIPELDVYEKLDSNSLVEQVRILIHLPNHPLQRCADHLAACIAGRNMKLDIKQILKGIVDVDSRAGGKELADQAVLKLSLLSGIGELHSCIADLLADHPEYEASLLGRPDLPITLACPDEVFTDGKAGFVVKYIVRHTYKYDKALLVKFFKECLKHSLASSMTTEQQSFLKPMMTSIVDENIDNWYSLFNTCRTELDLENFFKLSSADWIDSQSDYNSVLISLFGKWLGAGLDVDNVHLFQTILSSLNHSPLDERLPLILRALFAVTEEESLPFPSGVVFEQCIPLQRYLLVRFTSHEPLDKAVVHKLLQSGDLVDQITADMINIQNGEWNFSDDTILPNLMTSFSSANPIEKLIISQFATVTLIPNLEGYISETSNAADIRGMFEFCFKVWNLLEHDEMKVAREILLTICASAFDQVWPKAFDEDLSIIARFTNRIVQHMSQSGEASESAIAYLAAYDQGCIPLSGISVSALAKTLEQPISSAMLEKAEDTRGDFWKAFCLVFGFEVTMAATRVLQGQGRNVDFLILHHLVLSKVNNVFEKRDPACELIGCSTNGIIEKLTIHFNPFIVLCQNLLCIQGCISFDADMDIQVPEECGNVPLKSSFFDHILQVVVQTSKNTGSMSADGLMARLIEDLCKCAPVTIGQCRLLSKYDKTILGQLIERHGHKAYKAKVHEQAVLINRYLTSEGILAHYDAGTIHVRIWDSPQHKSASIDIDVFIDAAQSIPLTLPKVSIDSEVKGFGERTKLQIIQMLKSDVSTKTAGMIFDKFIGAGSHSLILAVAKIAQQFQTGFSEVEDCIICYTRFHRATKSFPTERCANCDNNFHKECLQQ